MSVSAGIARTKLAELHLAAMPLPNETVSEEQHNRTYHLDVAPALTLDLERELAAVQVLLYLAPDASAWFYQREGVIRDELAKRRAE